MGQLTHRIMFTVLFTSGAIGFLIGVLYQFEAIQNIFDITFIRWTAPIGLGLLLIGGTGMYITSKRHQMKKLKQVEVIEDDDDQTEGQVGRTFQDYITSPEEGITVYTFFLAGVTIMVWGSVMFVQWIRSVF